MTGSGPYPKLSESASIQYTVTIIHFNIIFLSSPMPHKFSLLFNFYEKVLCCLSCPSYVIDLSTVMACAVSAQIRKNALCNSTSPRYFTFFWFQVIIFGSCHELCKICIGILINLDNIRFKLSLIV